MLLESVQEQKRHTSLPTDYVQATAAEREAFLLEQGGRAWLAALTVEEREAVAYYCLVGYLEMNRALRLGEYVGIYGVRKERDQTDRLIALVQRSLLRVLAPADQVLQRAVSDSRIQTYLDAQGTVIEERGFTSATIAEAEYAFGYLKARIFVPSGSPGAYVEPLVRRAGRKEWEFLLPPGARFLVRRVYRDETGKYVELDYLGTEIRKSDYE